MDVEQRRKWIWTAAVLLLLAVAGFAGWKFGLPGYRHFKEARSVTQAREFVANGDYRSAVLALRRALAINSTNVEAARLMADLAFSTQSPESLWWWRRVVELDPSPAHKLRYAATALRSEKSPYPITSQVVQELAPTSATNVSFHLIAAQLNLELGRLREAETHLQSAAQLDPTNRLYQLNLATVRLKSSDPSVAEASRREIAELASDKNLGHVALRSLTAEALLREALPEAERFSQRLLALSQATFQDRLQHLNVLKKAKSPALPAQLEDTQRVSATNVVRAAQMLAWLNANEYPREALTWTGTLPPEIRATFPVPLMEAQCYVNLKEWAGLESRLSEQRWEAEQEFLRLALLTRALREQGRREVADANWRRTMGAANPRAGSLVALLQLISSWNWKEERVEILWAIVRRSTREDWAWQSLLQTYHTDGDTEGLHRVYSALLERQPDSEELRNNVASVALLLNRDIEKASELARQAYEARKTNAAIVSTYAFALFRQGKAQEGLQVMQSVAESSLRRPDIALYYAVLLSAAGQREKAGPFIAIAEKGRLLPEEKQLLAAAKGNG